MQGLVCVIKLAGVIIGTVLTATIIVWITSPTHHPTGCTQADDVQLKINFL